jgi:hypothetical protein
MFGDLALIKLEKELERRIRGGDPALVKRLNDGTSPTPTLRTERDTAHS